MSNPNEPDAESVGEEEQDSGQDAESKIYASIIRYLAERLSETEPDADPGDLVHTGELFGELADAFDHSGGFEFSSDQALVLAHSFSMLEGGMRILAEQADASGHTNAAAKMEWAAMKTRAMTSDLETHHIEGASGIITLTGRDDKQSDDTSKIDQTPPTMDTKGETKSEA